MIFMKDKGFLFSLAGKPPKPANIDDSLTQKIKELERELNEKEKIIEQAIKDRE